MLPKQRRVKRKLFVEIMRNGQTINGPHVILKFLSNLGQRESRCSFVVPKKIARMASERNLLKRRGAYCIETLDKPLPISFAGVFFLKGGAENLSFPELCSEITRLLSNPALH